MIIEGVVFSSEVTKSGFMRGRGEGEGGGNSNTFSNSKISGEKANFCSQGNNKNITQTFYCAATFHCTSCSQVGYVKQLALRVVYACKLFEQEISRMHICDVAGLS